MDEQTTPQGTPIPEESLADEEGSVTTDLAQQLGQKICKKTGLKQLFMSLNISIPATKLFE